MNRLASMTKAQIVREYRVCYASHQQLAQSYADGDADATSLRASANHLKSLRAALQVANECP